MPVKSTRFILLACLGLSLLGGCSSTARPPASVQELTELHGSVVSVGPIQTAEQEHQQLPLSTAGLNNSNISGKGSIAGGIAGALAGGLAAQAAQQTANGNGTVIRVKLDQSDRVVAVVQEGEVQLQAGQRVRILGNGSHYRVIPE